MTERVYWSIDPMGEHFTETIGAVKRDERGRPVAIMVGGTSGYPRAGYDLPTSDGSTIRARDLVLVTDRGLTTQLDPYRAADAVALLEERERDERERMAAAAEHGAEYRAALLAYVRDAAPADVAAAQADAARRGDEDAARALAAARVLVALDRA